MLARSRHAAGFASLAWCSSLVAVAALVGCGPATARCDQSRTILAAGFGATTLDVCVEYSGFSGSDEATYRSACSTGSTFTYGGCNLSSVRAGCRFTLGANVSQTDWYPNRVSDNDVRAHCQRVGASYVAR